VKPQIKIHTKLRGLDFFLVIMDLLIIMNTMGTVLFERYLCEEKTTIVDLSSFLLRLADDMIKIRESAVRGHYINS
jgi:hypothetical protein